MEHDKKTENVKEESHRHDAEPSPYYGEQKERPKQSFASSVFDIAEMFAICAAVVLIIFTFVARLTVVDGKSMEPTLYNNEYILIRSVGYEPKRGDIVVVNIPSSTGHYDHPLIKRVIAVGGDTLDIDFDTWSVYVNGEKLDESYINYEAGTTMRGKGGFEFPMTLPEG